MQEGKKEGMFGGNRPSDLKSYKTEGNKFLTEKHPLLNLKKIYLEVSAVL